MLGSWPWFGPAAETDQADRAVDELVNHDLIARRELADGDPQVAVDRAWRRPGVRRARVARVQIARLSGEAEHRQQAMLGKALREIGMFVLERADRVDARELVKSVCDRPAGSPAARDRCRSAVAKRSSSRRLSSAAASTRSRRDSARRVPHRSGRER